MNMLTKFVEQESKKFEVFDNTIGTFIFNGYTSAIREYLKRSLASNGKEATLELGHGTYVAKVREKGDSVNVNIAFDPSDAFLKSINGKNVKFSAFEKYNEEFIKLFCEYAGCETGDLSKHNANGVLLKFEEGVLFCNRITNLLIDTINDCIDDGVLQLDMPEHGVFEVKSEKDKLVMSFINDKVLSNYIKDDAIKE